MLRARRGEAAAPLLYLAGEERAGDLAAGGARVVTVVVYRALKAEHFAPEVAAALARRALDGVLHFSTRSAQAYLDCASRDGILDAALAPLHVCISRQVAQPLAAAGAAAIRIAPRPDESAMIELVGAGVMRRHDVIAARSVRSLPRLRGRARVGGTQKDSLQFTPSPNPPPQAGEGADRAGLLLTKGPAHLGQSERRRGPNAASASTQRRIGSPAGICYDSVARLL